MVMALTQSRKLVYHCLRGKARKIVAKGIQKQLRTVET